MEELDEEYLEARPRWKRLGSTSQQARDKVINTMWLAIGRTRKTRNKVTKQGRIVAWPLVVRRKTTIKVWQAAAKRRLFQHFQHFSHTIARPIFSPFLLPTEPWKWVREAWPPPWLLISFLWRILDQTDGRLSILLLLLLCSSSPFTIVHSSYYIQLGHCLNNLEQASGFRSDPAPI